MKSMFKNRRNVTIYSLLAVCVLSFLVLLLMSLYLHTTASPVGLGIALIGIVFFGSLAIALRSGPPW